MPIGILAEVEDKAANCLKAIAAFEAALTVNTLERFPMQYAMTQNNLWDCLPHPGGGGGQGGQLP